MLPAPALQLAREQRQICRRHATMCVPPRCNIPPAEAFIRASMCTGISLYRATTGGHDALNPPQSCLCFATITLQRLIVKQCHYASMLPAELHRERFLRRALSQCHCADARRVLPDITFQLQLPGLRWIKSRNVASTTISSWIAVRRENLCEYRRGSPADSTE